MDHDLHGAEANGFNLLLYEFEPRLVGGFVMVLAHGKSLGRIQSQERAQEAVLGDSMAGRGASTATTITARRSAMPKRMTVRSEYSPRLVSFMIRLQLLSNETTLGK